MKIAGVEVSNKTARIVWVCQFAVMMMFNLNVGGVRDSVVASLKADAPAPVTQVAR